MLCRLQLPGGQVTRASENPLSSPQLGLTEGPAADRHVSRTEPGPTGNNTEGKWQLPTHFAATGFAHGARRTRSVRLACPHDDGGQLSEENLNVRTDFSSLPLKFFRIFLEKSQVAEKPRLSSFSIRDRGRSSERIFFSFFIQRAPERANAMRHARIRAWLFSVQNFLRDVQIESGPKAHGASTTSLGWVEAKNGLKKLRGSPPYQDARHKSKKRTRS